MKKLLIVAACAVVSSMSLKVGSAAALPVSCTGTHEFNYTQFDGSMYCDMGSQALCEYFENMVGCTGPISGGTCMQLNGYTDVICTYGSE